MEASEYQNKAEKTSKIKWGTPNAVDILILGLIGEVGSLATVLKKHLRDTEAYCNFEEHLFEEVGDILWYVTTSASRLEIKLDRWPTEQSPFNDVFHGLNNLHEKITEFSREKKVLVNPESSDKTKAGILILEILRDLASILDIYNSNLALVSQRNADKTLSYWCEPEDVPARCFDSDFIWYEQLPRKFIIDFIGIDDNKSLLLIMNGRPLGDRLTDNSYLDDGYRFHDIFHLAGVVTLGWSPVFRDLLQVKRKSNPRIDEVEDGARAAIVEEAVINHIYDYARPSFLEGIDRVELDLIKRIRNLVSGYEVSECEPWEWNDCIIKSYEMFRLLKTYGEGRIELDADRRSMTFHQLPENPR